jgi:hypothetical protein
MPDRLPVRLDQFAPAPIRRGVARQLAALDDAETLGRAVIGAQTGLARARVESVVHVTEMAMLGAGHISTVEGCLVAASPWAERRLRGIAVAGCLGLQGIVTRHAEGGR